jgi:hypothetical protein
MFHAKKTHSGSRPMFFSHQTPVFPQISQLEWTTEIKTLWCKTFLFLSQYKSTVVTIFVHKLFPKCRRLLSPNETQYPLRLVYLFRMKNEHLKTTDTLSSCETWNWQSNHREAVFSTNQCTPSRVYATLQNTSPVKVWLNYQLPYKYQKNAERRL